MVSETIATCGSQNFSIIAASESSLGVQTFVHRADHNGLVAVGAFFQHGKQMVLFAKLAHQRVAAEQTDFTDPPVAADVIQHAIGEQRLGARGETRQSRNGQYASGVGCDRIEGIARSSVA